MKRHIYLLFTALMCTFMACKKEVIDVRDFGRISVDSISPATGPAGTYVLVHGNNFTNLASDAKVLIKNTEVRIITMSPDSMIIQIPESAATGELVFNFNRKNPTGGFDYSGQVDSAFTGPVFKVDAAAIPVPVIMQVLPAQSRPGEAITINGYNFTTGACKVFFGEMEAIITTITSTSVTVKVPALEPGKVLLTVKQGTHSISAGSFVVDEVPKGVKEIYFCANPGTGGEIRKATFDESGNASEEVLYGPADGAGGTASIAVDTKNGWIYWVADYTRLCRGAIDGTGPVETVYEAVNEFMIADVAIDNDGNAYFGQAQIWGSAPHVIMKIHADGTSQELYNLNGSVNPAAIKIDPVTRKLYWVEVNTGNLCEGSLEGPSVQEPTILFDASDGIVACTNFAIGNGRVYLLDLGLSDILTGALDGSGTLERLNIPSLGDVADLELDATNGYLYWMMADNVNGAVMRCKIDGTGSQRIVEGLVYAYYLQLIF